MLFVICEMAVRRRVLASSHHTTHRRVECVQDRCVQTWHLSSKTLRADECRADECTLSKPFLRSVRLVANSMGWLHCIFFWGHDHYLWSSTIIHDSVHPSLPDKVDALQVKLLRRMLQKQGVRTGLHGVEVNSVDGFQGREKEARHRPIHFVAGHKDFTCRIFVQNQPLHLQSKSGADGILPWSVITLPDVFEPSWFNLRPSYLHFPQHLCFLQQLPLQNCEAHFCRLSWFPQWDRT